MGYITNQKLKSMKNGQNTGHGSFHDVMGVPKIDALFHGNSMNMDDQWGFKGDLMGFDGIIYGILR